MHPRAQWVALRTFRRRVKRCGQTAAGAPMFTMGSVMLTYPPGARHFFPVAHCSRCDGVIELPEPILSRTDLDLSNQPHLCQGCARGGVARVARPARPRPDPAQSPPPSSSPPPPRPRSRSTAASSEPDLNFGDDLERAETEVAAIVGAAMSRAVEIHTEAVQAAATLLAAAETEAAELRAAAETEIAGMRAAAEAEVVRMRLSAEADSSEIREAALRSHDAAEAELEAAIALNAPRSPEDRADVAEREAAAEADAARLLDAARHREQAEDQARALLAEAESRAAEMRAMAEADAARWRETAERSKEQASAILAQAEAQAAQVLDPAAAGLDAAVALRPEEVGSQVPPSAATDDRGGDGHEA